MPFTSETAKKAGAKSSRKGSGNKATAELRERVSMLLDSQFDSIVNDLAQLDPKDRVNAYIRLMEFALPKLNRTDVTSGGGSVNIPPIEWVKPSWMDEPLDVD